MDFINNLPPQNRPENKRLLFIITLAEMGGAQRFISQLINNLPKDKFRCTIVTGAEGKQQLKDSLPSNTEYITSKKLKRNPSLINDLSSILEIKKIIKNVRPDTLFLNSSKSGFNGSLAVKLLPSDFKKPKVIYRIGGWSFNDPRSKITNTFYRFLEKISAPWKDYIILNNQHDFNQALKYKIKPREKILLIHNGIDPYKLDFKEKDEAKLELYKKLNLKDGDFINGGLIIGTVANLYPSKGIQYLVDAFSIFTSQNTALKSKLIIIGDGPEKSKLENKIITSGLQDKISLGNSIPDAYKYIKSFDIFVLPSVKEGFPWALLEAMSAKLPVIATSVGANPEIIENNKNGLLVKPRNAKAISDAITKIVSDESFKKEIGIQAHQTIIDKFNLRKMVDQIENLL